MTENRHTPGPWRYSHAGPVMRGYSQPFAIAQVGEANLIAGCFGDVRGGADTAEANARLISAAPDLLAALEEIVRIGRSHGRYAANLAAASLVATQAIAKARAS